jgi:hypothetical protein
MVGHLFPELSLCLLFVAIALSVFENDKYQKIRDANRTFQNDVFFVQ